MPSLEQLTLILLPATLLGSTYVVFQNAATVLVRKAGYSSGGAVSLVVVGASST